MAQQGKRVLLIGCDPKSDTTSLLFSGRSCPTIIETSSKKKLAGEAVKIGDVCFKRDGVFAMELGGPEVGRGCGGRGIIHGFELLEKLGFHDAGIPSALAFCTNGVVPTVRSGRISCIEAAADHVAEEIQQLYFTNMVSARPLFGSAGAGALAAIVAAQTKGRERFGRMVGFFDKVGAGETSGYGRTGIPKDPPGSKDRYRKAREAKAKATRAVGT
jgi:3,8-divinyl chlorophyllide a/chlorophyllide a reductase subunit X